MRSNVSWRMTIQLKGQVRSVEKTWRWLSLKSANWWVGPHGVSQLAAGRFAIPVRTSVT